MMPKLPAATADSEKAVLQNRCRRRGTTDQQIDQLVYELDQLTPEEIALVEGAAFTPLQRRPAKANRIVRPHTHAIALLCAPNSARGARRPHRVGK
ncbi:MAG: hypothetical protein EXS33_07480 [Pedosphaera sp.]|nr:hypothetical protein [Pedosphaera sp.]